MSGKFASGKFSIAACDRCGQRYKLRELRTQTLKTKPWHIKVCKTCYEKDHPQLQIGMFPVTDFWAVRDPRPDVEYYMSGTTGLQINITGGTSELGLGFPGGGSRVIQWGWNPVGGSRANDMGLTPNYLIAVGEVGTVTIQTT